jgi:hypothetical protein
MMPPPSLSAYASEPERRISTWTLTTLIGVPLIAAAIVASYFFFTAPIPHDPPETSGLSPQEATAQLAAAELELARMHAEARRNTLATGAGFAAIAALILALRRQHHHEKSTANAEADALRRQEHLEQKAADDKDDALQRRITDARIRAVEQLGSDNAAVRIGGLHNLERIGQQHEELRQVVLDEICAYLRLPYTPPGSEEPERLPAGQFEPIGPPPAEAESDDSEREVRLIAQEILQRHLKPDSRDLFWNHSRLNLRNAHLEDIRLDRSRLTQADFTDAIFTGHSGFEGATFTGRASFEGATFTGWTRFLDATFSDRAEFGSAIFAGDAGFDGSTFAHVEFRNVIFAGDAGFKSTTFNEHAGFDGAIFIRDVWFKNMTFSDSMFFQRTRFQGNLHRPSPALAVALQKWGARLSTATEHDLPKDWRLEPIPEEPAWGLVAIRSLELLWPWPLWLR